MWLLSSKRGLSSLETGIGLRFKRQQLTALMTTGRRRQLIPDDEIEQIRTKLQVDGFAVSQQRILSADLCYELRENRFPALFRGEFETGLYPDEWHWRQGLSLPEVTREICNAWKSDRTIASAILSSEMGRTVSRIMGWDSVRIGQDDVIWKPPALPASTAVPEPRTIVGYHQDSAYVSVQFEPYAENSITAWIALEDVDESTSCVEYVPGSHWWRPLRHLQADDGWEEGAFHDTDRLSYQKSIPRPPEEANQRVEPVAVPVSEGHVIFHHQDVWHGSGPNVSTTKHRRSLVAHYLNGTVTFRADDRDSSGLRQPWGVNGYIYGRYKKQGSVQLDESFFPVIYSRDDKERTSHIKRSAWLDSYIDAVK